MGEYFAAVAASEVGQKIWERVKQAREVVGSAPLRTAWSKAHEHAFAAFEASGATSVEIRQGGSEGELAAVRVPRSKAVLTAWASLLLSAAVTWRPTCSRADAGARGQIQWALNLLEWFWKRRGGAQTVSRWVEQSLRYASAWVFVEWDWSRGPAAVAGDDVGMLRQGDAVLHNLLPWEVAFDPSYGDAEASPWVACVLRVNRYELARLYPQTVDGKPVEAETLGVSSSAVAPRTTAKDGLGEDVAEVVHFFHRPSALLPEGLEVVLASDTQVLVHGPLRSKCLPILRLAPEEMDAAPWGYTPGFDILGIQEVSDANETTIATNQLTFGRPTVALDEGTQLDNRQFDGMRALVLKPGQRPPVAVNLTSTPREIFDNQQRLQSAQRDLVGLNDVAMGQPQTAQMNAQAFAILASMASQRSSVTQQRVYAAIGRLGFAVLSVFAGNVRERRLIDLVGRGPLESARWFDGSLIDAVDGVNCEIGPAIEQSVAGKFQLAEQFLKLGVVKTAEDLQQVYATGRLEHATSAAESQRLLISNENERLLLGETPAAHLFDNHLAHVVEHQAAINSKEARESEEIAAAVQAHVDEHYALFFGLPPEQAPQQDPLYLTRIRVLLGQQAPDLGQPPGPPQNEGAAPEGGNVQNILTQPAPQSAPASPNAPPMPGGQ